MLGVSLEDADKGARVVQVLTDTGAEKAGVQVNDVIVSLDDRPVRSREELSSHPEPSASATPSSLASCAMEDHRTHGHLGQRIQGPASQPNRSEMMNRMGGELPGATLAFQPSFSTTPCSSRRSRRPAGHLKGEVIGINIARAGRTESYALPADVIKRSSMT